MSWGECSLGRPESGRPKRTDPAWRLHPSPPLLTARHPSGIEERPLSAGGPRAGHPRAVCHLMPKCRWEALCWDGDRQLRVGFGRGLSDPRCRSTQAPSSLVAGESTPSFLTSQDRDGTQFLTHSSVWAGLTVSGVSG